MDSFNEKFQFTSGTMITWQQHAMHSKYIFDGIHTFLKVVWIPHINTHLEVSCILLKMNINTFGDLKNPAPLSLQCIHVGLRKTAIYPIQTTTLISPTPRLKQNYLCSTQMQMKNLLKQINAHQNSVIHANYFITSKHPPNWNELNTCMWDTKRNLFMTWICLINLKPLVS